MHTVRPPVPSLRPYQRWIEYIDVNETGEEENEGEEADEVLTGGFGMWFGLFTHRSALTRTISGVDSCQPEPKPV